MLSEEEKKLLKIFKAQVEEEETEYFSVNAYTQLLYDSHKTVLNLITKLQKENEEKDKQIDLMANSILTREIGKNSCQFNKTCTKFEKGRDIHCKDCVKQYFERKVEDETK